ncbi:MAG: inorganic phosphate transporter [Armatimonadota bacterium]|nr:inorganic phosphate transporter [Armatimonadota bacterium]
MLYLIIGIIFVALVFDYINGFHDAANSIATVVATKVLHPRYAVMWAAFWNFIAFIFFGVHVAKTIGKGVIQPDAVTVYVILAGLVGAILWDIITWYFGLPTSSSHALIGGFVGAALIKSGFATDILIAKGLYRILLFIVLSPIIGLLLGYINMVIIMWICRKKMPGRVGRWFRSLQLVSAAAYSLGHGMNDAQKTMGIIWILLMTGGYLSNSADLPLWVVLSCHAAIALGTLSGGWRIVKTMGLGITKLRPVGGFAAETAGAITLIGLSMNGIPVSTTHTITGAIVGVGATNRLSAVRWGVAGRIVWAWILTIPMSALIAGLTYLAIKPFI